MLGPSGSGKTTVLRMIAGFEQPTAGAVHLGGRDVTRDAPFDRDVNTVFQDYALFPHMSVRAERRLRPDGQGRRPRPSAAPGPTRRWPAVRLERLRRPAAGPALRRPAAAGRAGPGAGQPAPGAAARRAARRPRPQAARADAGRAQGHPARRRHHLPVRHPRPGGGADDERPDRGLQPAAGSSRSARRARSTSARRRRSSPASSARRTCCSGEAAQAAARRPRRRLGAPGEGPGRAGRRQRQPARSTRRGRRRRGRLRRCRRPGSSCGWTPAPTSPRSCRTPATGGRRRPARGDRVQVGFGREHVYRPVPRRTTPAADTAARTADDQRPRTVCGARSTREGHR